MFSAILYSLFLHNVIAFCAKLHMTQPQPQLRKLMKMLDRKPYYIKKEQKYVVVEE